MCVCLPHETKRRRKGIKNFRLLLAMIPRSAHINSPWNRHALAHSTERLRRLCCWTRRVTSFYFYIYYAKRNNKKEKRWKGIRRLTVRDAEQTPSAHAVCVCVCVAVSPSLLSIYSTRTTLSLSSLYAYCCYHIYTSRRIVVYYYNTSAFFFWGLVFSVQIFFNVCTKLPVAPPSEFSVKQFRPYYLL